MAAGSARGQWLVIGVLAVGMGFLVSQQVAARIDTNDAIATAQKLAEPVDDLCKDDPTARRRIGTERCDQAAEVQRDPTAAAAAAAPRDGTDGTNGRGIRSTAIDASGHLIVTFTDGAREDEGVVVGATGAAGPNGRGIAATTVDETGQLVLTFTDGVTDAVGRVVGATGDDGRPGRGVARTEARDGRLLVYYDDAPSQPVDVGPLPAGPAGRDGAAGRGIRTLDLDLATCTVTVYYTDDTSEVKPATGCDESPPPTSTTTNPPPALLPVN